MNMLNFVKCFVILTAIGLLTACGGDGGGSPGSAAQVGGSGTVAIALTDQPACGFDHVFVTVTRVRVHRSASADDTSSGWTDIVVAPARRIDLLELTNGRMEELGVTPLAAGNYTQLRLVLVPNAGGAPANNSVVPTGGVETALVTPSAVQSGLKLIHPFTVEAGKRVDLVIDFDACRSIVRRGNGSFGLKPVLRASLMEVAEFVGYVDKAIADVTVTAQKNGTVVRGTKPDADGLFRLAWLRAASAPYDVVFTAPGRATTVVRGVTVTQDTTTLSTITSPISLGPSPVRQTAGGTVNPVEARDDGAVRALQAVGSVPQVEVATVNVDAISGEYSLILPTASPRLAAYSTTLPLTFAPQDATARLYTLEASATGFATQPRAIDLTAGNVTANFILAP